MLHPHPELEEKKYKPNVGNVGTWTYFKSVRHFRAGLVTCEVVYAYAQMHACQWACTVYEGLVQGEQEIGCHVRCVVRLWCLLR